MAKLNDEIKELLVKQLVFIATASKDGTPNVGPKGSMFAIDDETIVYSESTAKKTLANLWENPKVCVLAVDRNTAHGYQIKGTAELIPTGDLFDRVARRQEERKKSRPNHVVKITVEDILPV
ncbi:MAG: pyridoxamine 5'-phosphate oxidase family protein [Dehalococcoidia bacterium]|nr:pyridoxamine 5'-phosphate oxidase family protein [Dehalococcoidia bacterium]MDZ4247229.1 pyridoxamine 5'-phosphate oxidase family protein [Dehalococcoidia bacterium]